VYWREDETRQETPIPQSGNNSCLHPLSDKVAAKACEARSSFVRIEFPSKKMCKFLLKISTAFPIKSNEPF